MKAKTARPGSKSPKKEEKCHGNESAGSIDAGNQRALLKGMRDWDPVPYSPVLGDFCIHDHRL